MNTKYKSTIIQGFTFFLIFAFALSFSSPAFATYNIFRSQKAVAIPDSVYAKAEYSKLKNLTLVDEKVNSYAAKVETYEEEFVQSKCIRDYEINDFSEFKISGYDLASVSQINERLYFQYTSPNEDQLYLVYLNDQLIEQTAYNSRKDTLTVISGKNVATETEFMAEAFHDYTTKEGILELEKEEAALTLNSAAKTNFYPPQTSFPIIKHKILLSQNKQCSALQNKYVNFRAMESRYNYKKKTADFKTFAASTGITLVAAYLGGPASLAVKVLTAMGVGISTADTINNAAQIYKRVIYTYRHGWQGYAFDSTSQNAYVLVKRNLKSGEFTFGLNKSNKWVWVISLLPTNSMTNSYLISQAHSMYNSELMSISHPGVNTIYFSDAAYIK